MSFSEMGFYEEATLLGLWLGSIGTVGAVVYALFGTVMRRWFNNPNLEFNVSKDFPFCSVLERGGTTESTSDLDVIEICGSVINTKKYCAQHSRVMCIEICVLEADGRKFCPFIKFRPKQFQWLDVSSERQNMEIDIGQSVTQYVKIAEISNDQSEMTATNGTNQTAKSDGASITVAIPDPRKPGSSYVRIPFEHKCVLIKMQVICSGCSPKTYDVQIDWKGNSVNDFEQPGKLSVSSVKKH